MTMAVFDMPRVWRKLSRDEVNVHRCIFYHAEHRLTHQDIAVFTRLDVTTVKAAVKELMDRKLLPSQYYAN